MTILGRRLKQARLAAGMSQEQLGIQADIDPMSASTRMNRYELGHRVPAYDLIERVARVLKLPAAYFYAADDEEAELLGSFHRLPKTKRSKLLTLARELQ